MILSCLSVCQAENESKSASSVGCQPETNFSVLGEPDATETGLSGLGTSSFEQVPFWYE